MTVCKPHDEHKRFVKREAAQTFCKRLRGACNGLSLVLLGLQLPAVSNSLTLVLFVGSRHDSVSHGSSTATVALPS